MKHMEGLGRFLLIIGILFVSAATLYAGDKDVVAEGMSGISRADAIRKAQRAAVEQAVGVFIHSETETQNFVVQKDKILSRTQGYVTRFDILKESEQSGVYTVNIRATVSLDKIKDDLIAMKILLDSMARPKLMVLVAEDYLDMSKPGMRIAETELSAALQAKGFELVDKAQLESANAKDKALQALAGNLEAASRLGMRFGAQYVVIGKAVVQDAGEAVAGTGLHSLQSSLQVKVVQSQSGLLLGSAVKNGVAAHVSPLTGATIALKKVVKKTLDEYLVNAVTESFQDYLNNGVPLKLYVTGVDSYRQYKKVAAEIENIVAVASSKKEAWNKTSGLLVLDLRFKGTSEDLAETLDGRNLGEKSFEVVDLAPDRVDCNVK